ncbi:hypothetical protein SHXM_00157 [Streptomyces hygroscopicus]|nr:hypothetical protein SHXM_00157 [Streptomyces hygroscopicus]
MGNLADAHLEDRHHHRHTFKNCLSSDISEETRSYGPYSELFAQLAMQRLRCSLTGIRLATRQIKDIRCRLLAHHQEAFLLHDHGSHDGQRLLITRGRREDCTTLSHHASDSHSYTFSPVTAPA